MTSDQQQHHLPEISSDLRILRQRMLEMIGLPSRDAFFSHVAATYDRDSHYLYASINRLMLSELLSRQPRRIIDLGSGTGETATWLASRLPEAEVIGIDRSPGMLAQARAKAQSLGLQNVRFIEADVIDGLRSLGDRSQDAIVMCFALSYLRGHDVFQAIRRALQPEGVFGFTTSTLRALKEFRPVFYRILLRHPLHLLRSGLWRLPPLPRNAQHVQRLLEREGFRVEMLHQRNIRIEASSPAAMLHHLTAIGYVTDMFYQLPRMALREQAVDEILELGTNLYGTGPLTANIELAAGIFCKR